MDWESNDSALEVLFVRRSVAMLRRSEGADWKESSFRPRGGEIRALWASMDALIPGIRTPTRPRIGWPILADSL